MSRRHKDGDATDRSDDAAPEEGAEVARVLVADDHPLVVDGMVGHLDADPGLEVVATASDGAELIERFRQYRPDVVVTDLHMPGLSGLDAATKILDEAPAARIILVSEQAHEDTVSAAFRIGCTGCLSKAVAGPELVQHVRSAARGEPVFDLSTARLMVDTLRDAKRQRQELTDREVQVLRLVSEGMTNGQVAAELFISPQTVKTHLERIYGKLRVSDRTRAVMRGLELGLLDLSVSEAENGLARDTRAETIDLDESVVTLP